MLIEIYKVLPTKLYEVCISNKFLKFQKTFIFLMIFLKLIR